MKHDEVIAKLIAVDHQVAILGLLIRELITELREDLDRTKSNR